MKKLFILFSLLTLTASCGIYKYSDAKTNPVNANERVQKNIEEGRGFRLGGLGKKGGDQTIHILKTELNQIMEQLCCEKISDLPFHILD